MKEHINTNNVILDQHKPIHKPITSFPEKSKLGLGLGLGFCEFSSSINHAPAVFTFRSLSLFDLPSVLLWEHVSCTNFFFVSGVVCFCLVCVQEAIVVSASSFSLLCCCCCFCWYSISLLLQRLLVVKDHGAHGWRMDICGSQYGGNFLSLSLS